MTRPATLDPSAPILSLRQAAGLTGTECAEACGMSRQAVKNIERREGRVLLSSLVEMAKSLGYDVEIRVSR